MTLYEQVTFWIRKDAIRLELWCKDYTNVDDYIRDKVNAMTNNELLEAISSAMEVEKVP